MSTSLLLVEDNEDDIFFLQVAMKRAGISHELVVARDGREAVARLLDFQSAVPGANPIGLMLLDLSLPYLSGLEVLAWMQSHPESGFPPVVVLTTSEKGSDLIAARQFGAAGFLLKPNRPDQLAELLRTLDEDWLSGARPPASPGAPWRSYESVPAGEIR